MFCTLDCGNFDNFGMMDSYQLKENEYAEQGEILNNSWIVCCASLYDGKNTENRVYHAGEYIRIVDLTQLRMFSSDKNINHPDFKWIGATSMCLSMLNRYENINYDPRNNKSDKLTNIIRN